jgi:predicted AAA+ superfamily ATPase
MIIRPYWIKRIHSAWEKRSIIWLSGVRRIGKTTLCKMIPDSQYFNCDLPSVQNMLKDPEQFLKEADPGSVLILDRELLA